MSTILKLTIKKNTIVPWGRHGRDRMVVGFTTTCAISTYHHYKCCELKSH